MTPISAPASTVDPAEVARFDAIARDWWARLGRPAPWPGTMARR